MPLLDVIRYFRWQSVIDILLVGFLLYQLYLWVRESRAVRALIGLAVLGALSLAARWSDLTMAGWLFESLWSMLLLLIVIVFQPEIRRILERMNPLDVFRGQRVVFERETLAELTEAAFSLARDKVGALVVLPGRDPVEEHLREGVQVEAVVSRELLCTLFQPPAPTHDGAVVIRSNRIERAACFLPMTTTSGLPSEYGARHRAAIGLTERCDALCVLVSEERGTVALAHQGTLTPFFEPARLKQELEREIQDSLSDDALRGGGWTWLTRRWWAKGLAVGLVSVFWVTVVGQQSSEIALTVPIEYHQIAPMIELRGDVPREVNIRLRGSQLALEALRSRPMRARISLAQVREGTNFLPLTEGQLDLPPGVEITEIRPALVVLELGKKEGALTQTER
jgi:uncharacterized protein (TIGR00159 family)